MSGGLPPSMRVLSTVSWLEPMLSTWIAIPVALAKSAIAAAKPTPSPPVHCVWIETFLPLKSLVVERLVQLLVAGRDRRQVCRAGADAGTERSRRRRGMAQTSPAQTSAAARPSTRLGDGVALLAACADQHHDDDR